MAIFWLMNDRKSLPIGHKCNYSSPQFFGKMERSSIVVWLPMSAFALFKSNNSHSDKTNDFHGDQPGV